MNANADALPGARRGRFPVRPALVAAWLACMFWLVRHEIAPERFGGTLRGYDALLGADTLSRDTWMRVFRAGQPVGYSHHSLVVDEEALPGERIALQNTFAMFVDLRGERLPMRAEYSVFLDDWYRLKKFAFEGSFGDLDLRAAGARRLTDGRFAVSLSVAGVAQRAVIDIPDNAVLYSSMGGPLARRLRPGRRVVVNAFDPTTLQQTPVVIEALRWERLTIGTNTYATVVIATRGALGELLSWVDDEGEVVRAVTPFGWTLERSTVEEALATIRPP